MKSKYLFVPSESENQHDVGGRRTRRRVSAERDGVTALDVMKTPGHVYMSHGADWTLCRPGSVLCISAVLGVAFGWCRSKHLQHTQTFPLHAAR